MFTTQFNANGVLRWMRTFNAGANVNAVGWDIKSANGKYYVTGAYYHSTSNFNIVTFRYDSTGTPVWIREFDSPFRLLDVGKKLALDSAGNVYVFGYSFDSQYRSSLVVLKYTPDGRQRLNWLSGFIADDRPAAFAVDSQASIYLAASRRVDTTSAIVVLKLIQDSVLVPPPELPTNLQLRQNYPNPCNAMTMIEYEIPNHSRVRLEVYNILGQRIQTLEDNSKEPGYYSVSLTVDELPSGVYVYRLFASDRALSRKMVVLK